MSRSAIDPGRFDVLENAPLHDVLCSVVAAFRSERIALASGFGPGSAVLIHVLAELGIRIPVIFIDTLYHFPETIEHVERVHERYGLDLRVHRPADSRVAFEDLYGPRLWERDLDAYHLLTKIEPFRFATARLDAWITGRRRDQSRTRSTLPVIESGRQRRINPLAAWTRSDIWRFIRLHGLPYNPLHDDGYTSIGDEALTTRVSPGEDERAGRWRDLGRLECGIHLSTGSAG